MTMTTATVAAAPGATSPRGTATPVGYVQVPVWPGVTVTVSAAPAEYGPVGTIAVITRRGDTPDQVTNAIQSGAVRCWTTGMTVRRYAAAHALTQADVHPDMTACEIAAAILAVTDQATDPWFDQAAGQVAETMAACADLGIGTTPHQRRAYRRYWPNPTRTRLCLALADKLLSSTITIRTGGAR